MKHQKRSNLFILAFLIVACLSGWGMKMASPKETVVQERSLAGSANKKNSMVVAQKKAPPKPAAAPHKKAPVKPAVAPKNNASAKPAVAPEDAVAERPADVSQGSVRTKPDVVPQDAATSRPADVSQGSVRTRPDVAPQDAATSRPAEVSQGSVRTNPAVAPQNNARANPVAAPRARWHQSNLERHWEKHGSEFPEFHSAQEYGDAALNFFQNPPQGTLTKVRSDGEKLFYHPPSNTFGVTAPDGTPKTLFRPSGRMNYWNRQ